MTKITLILSSLLISFPAIANEQTEIRIFLEKFHSDTAKEMQRRPQEIVNGMAVDRGYINEGSRRVLKSRENSTLLPRFFSSPLENDLASTIVDGEVITNIGTLDSMQLSSGSVPQIPWADSYWPVYKGLLGHRYADPNFPESKNFLDNYKYFLANHPANLTNLGDAAAIDKLSPAEKYDLLVGDSNWTLTNQSWAEGQSYVQRNGFVPLWVGICHGWAAAAHMNAPISNQSVTVNSVHNVPITFHISDLKALQSMLWANASPATRFTGSKCLSANPQKNSVGRITEPTCVDNNPATFHLVMTNQLGRNKRSFVMDGTYDAEIWNFPLTAYSYRYFNPQTLQATTDYRQAIVPIESYTVDKFKEFRAPETRYVLGITMDDTYVVEIAPNRGSQSSHPTKTVRHFYDLELDANFNVIGGEWYANAHPDFIWTYDAAAKAQSIVDSQINPGEWIASVPASWTEHAQRASARGQPMAAIIEGILARQK